MLSISILIVLDIGVMACFIPKINNIMVGRRFQRIPNSCLALHKLCGRQNKAHTIFRFIYNKTTQSGNYGELKPLRNVFEDNAVKVFNYPSFRNIDVS